MLLPPKVAHGVADGSVTLAFRRWRTPDVKAGHRFTTVAGIVQVDESSPARQLHPLEVRRVFRTQSVGTDHATEAQYLDASGGRGGEAIDRVLHHSIGVAWCC